MENSTQLLNLAADNIRVLAVSMVERAKSGHPGGSMGGADFINVLYSEFLTYDPDCPTWECRDRFFLDPGHMSPMLYSQLALIGRFSLEDLKAFRQWGSVTPGHPEVNFERGIENTSGPLGQGHTYAVGAAIAAKALYARTGNPGFLKEKIYAYISDGGIQEEVSQGAGRIAGHLGLNNLIMFFDANEIQLSTETAAVISEDTAMKYRAWNWNVLEIDGNNPEQIRKALREANAETARPTLIIGHCVMGKGARQADGSSYERDCRTHGAPLGGDAYKNTILNLGADLEDPFVIRPEVKELYARRAEELKSVVGQRRAEEQAWAEANPEKAAQLADWMAGRLPDLPWDEIRQKPDGPTRNGSAACLSMLSKHVKNMIVSSADLCNSDKTDGFLAHTTEIRRDDFSGGFLQAGVSELTMACVCIGITLHGGMITAMGTFFVFSDYMKPAIRMAALMELPVKFVWSHDAFRVGEDGPTHEPVEQEAQIRLMEKLKNHSGRDSVRVLRPADVHDATQCWRMAMENTDTPTALIFSRQNIKDLPEGTDYTQTARGAYVVVHEAQPDVVLVASGSEVSTLVAAADLLKQDNIKARVVSCPSEQLFRNQDADYRESVLPKGIKKFFLTAGLPVIFEGLAGDTGRIFGLEHFGHSAPFNVLDEKFGFTPDNIYKEVKAYLAE
ncbi:transketolase [Alloprevotella sp. OH1205_COT-284]|uniref:transketolase family protein n=1 Tax=Alloprevotella sp. OH1205_COT-284 TaxID=2491043 RepID=UPI000F5E7A56|nr:transketolase [Alloprevotella sp. OH1205_COT-284]RRD80524.1 transketolase [Alloprevotella sp. OH1205_COT-284]